MDKMIIYRSRTEAEIDRMIWETPDLMINFFLIAATLIVSVLLGFKTVEFISRKTRKRFNTQVVVWILIAIYSVLFYNLFKVVFNYLIFL